MPRLGRRHCLVWGRGFLRGADSPVGGEIGFRGSFPRWAGPFPRWAWKIGFWGGFPRWAGKFGFGDAYPQLPDGLWVEPQDFLVGSNQLAALKAGQSYDARSAGSR